MKHIDGSTRVALRFLTLLKEDPELKEAVVALLTSITDSQTAQAEYRRSLAARHKKK